MESLNRESEFLPTEAAQASFGQLVDVVITSQASNAAVHLPCSHVSIQIKDLLADLATQTGPALPPDARLTVEELRAPVAYQPPLATPPAPADDRAIIQTGTQTANSPQAGQIDHSKAAKSFLTVLAQVVVSLATILYSNGNNPVSRNRSLLRDVAAGGNIIGYIALFTSLLICGRQTDFPAQVGAVIGYAGVGVGFSAIMGMLLPDAVNLWITFVACAVCLTASALAIHAASETRR